MALASEKRPTQAYIDLDALAFNFHSSKKFIGEGIKIMAVVKADAYGHGAARCAKRLEDEGVDWFGVALPEEGVELRNAGIETPILCLGSFWHGQEDALISHDLMPVIFQLDKAASLNRSAEKRKLELSIHVKIDTGMGRIGVRLEEVEKFADDLKKFDHLKLEGVMTHFASADDLSENDFTKLQIERFQTAVKIFEDKGFQPIYKDLANSPGAIGHPDARGNMVRLGGVLYGLGGDVLPKEIAKPKLKPVLSLHTKIMQLKKISKGETLGYGRAFTAERESLIATIPIGYQDGYSRLLSNNANVIVNGFLAPVVGRISMDWTIVDVTDVENANVDDEVILIGESGGQQITTEELAMRTGTISYEITCGINLRVPRHYLGDRPT